MGIDIYAKWRNMPKEDEDQQITGFSTTSGHLGYLREAYHGEPYVTSFLLKEAFESEDGQAKIPASVLRERLPQALLLASERMAKVYKIEDLDGEEATEVRQAFVNFVDLCEKKEQETGEPVTIIASY